MATGISTSDIMNGATGNSTFYGSYQTMSPINLARTSNGFTRATSVNSPSNTSNKRDGGEKTNLKYSISKNPYAHTSRSMESV